MNESSCNVNLQSSEKKIAKFGFEQANTVKPVLETICFKRPPALRDTVMIQQPFLKQPSITCIQKPAAVRDHFQYFL